VVLTLAAPLACTGAEPSWSLDQLMIELGRVQHAKARFVERKYLKLLTQPLELTGTLEYRAPDHLERRTLTPKPESFVVDGDVLTLENARGQRRTLKGDLGALRRFYDVSLEGGEKSWQLSLNPKQPRMSAIISMILIGGTDGKIGTIEIREAKGDRSVMTVHEEGA
jgi:hypothetical protein